MKGGSMKNKYIKVNINTIPKTRGKTVLTDAEKQARLYALAEKLNVQIGGKEECSKQQ